MLKVVVVEVTSEEPLLITSFFFKDIMRPHGQSEILLTKYPAILKQIPIHWHLCFEDLSKVRERRGDHDPRQEVIEDVVILLLAIFLREVFKVIQAQSLEGVMNLAEVDTMVSRFRVHHQLREVVVAFIHFLEHFLR